jgi:hypothetical protein
VFFTFVYYQVTRFKLGSLNLRACENTPNRPLKSAGDTRTQPKS